jgi:NADPH:quinone reductase-like Zn-dependent oxidoreductase
MRPPTGFYGSLTGMPTTMYALATDAYGPLSNLQIRELPMPEPGPGQVRVRVVASALNPADAKTVQGKITLLHAKTFPLVTGWDLSGVVDKLGSGVEDLQPGQEVFGFHAYSRRTRQGAFAEYTVLPAAYLAPKPKDVSHATAAASATVGLTVLQALRAARLAAEGRILFTGASGGVGAVGIGIARLMGGTADAVTSTDCVDFVRALGAGRIYDRREQAWLTKVQPGYDVVFDAAAAYSMRFFRRVLRRGGSYITTLPKAGFLLDLLAMPLLGRRPRMIAVKPARPDLERLGSWLASGLAVPVAKTVDLAHAAAAMADFAEHGCQGKIVVQVEATRAG